MTTEISASTLDQLIWEMTEKYRVSDQMKQSDCFICNGTGQIGPLPSEVCTHMVYGFFAVDMVNRALQKRFSDVELAQVLSFVVCVTGQPLAFQGISPDEQIGEGESWEEFLSFFMACQIMNIMFTRTPELQKIDAGRRRKSEAREVELVNAMASS